MASDYYFTVLKGKNFNILHDKAAADYLLKWSMKGQIQAATFSFNEPFQTYQKKSFVEAFFRDPTVMTTVNTCLPQWYFEKDKMKDVYIEDVPCTLISMEFFDRVLDPRNGIVRQGGNLHHCVDDTIDDFTISDELRKMILNEESDNFGLYNEKDKKEFLYRLFEHLVLGGKWCQFEDKVEPYLEMTKMAYKDLVRVERNSETKDIEIKTLCYKIIIKGEKEFLFPVDADHRQNFTYLLIDPTLRQVTLFAHEYGGQF